MTKRATIHRSERDEETVLIKVPRMLPRPIADTLEDIDEATLISSASSSSSRPWGSESVAGCVMSNTMAPPTHGTRAGRRVSSWTAVLLGSAIVAIVVVATVLRLGPARQADRAAATTPRTLTENVTANAAPPPPSAVTQPSFSQVAVAPTKPRQGPSARPILRAKPDPRPMPPRTVRRAPAIKRPASKVEPELDVETKQALEVLRNAKRMESASSFDE